MKKMLISTILLFLIMTQAMAKDNDFFSIRGSYGDEMSLSWHCKDDELIVSLAHYILIDISSLSTIIYKFDDKPFSPENTFSLAKGDAITRFNKNKITAFTRQALSSNKVVIIVSYPLYNKEIASAFELDGLSEALSKLSCYQ